MAKILDMPKLSPTMEEGVLSAWHKKEGDAVGVDDLLAEVETDKATMEFRAFDKGTLLKILVPAGSHVKLGQPVAVLGNAGEDVSALVAEAGGGGAPETQKPAQQAQPAQAAPPAQQPAPREAKEERVREQASTEAPKAQRPAPRPATQRSGSALDRTDREREGNGHGATAQAAPGGGGRVMASPYVRKAARERGIDLAGAQGTGPHGRVVARDLEGLAARAPAGGAEATSLVRTMPAPALAGLGLAEPEVRPLSMMRKTIARRLTESKQTVPHFYLTIDVDASRLVTLREQINAELAPKKNGAATDGAEKPLKVSLNDLLVKACAAALVRVPECNAQFTPEAILVHRRVDISVAVAVPDGLVTPVVRNADQKSVVAIAREVKELAARARAKKLRPEDMSDGTFSISNLGMFGIDSFAAVINPPEGAILAVGQVRDEPVVDEGRIVPGKRLGMTLSCDHRVVDGAVGASFLAELRALLEHPMRVLTG